MAAIFLGYLVFVGAMKINFIYTQPQVNRNILSKKPEKPDKEFEEAVARLLSTPPQPKKQSKEKIKSK